MTIQMAGVAGGKEHTIKCLFRNHRSFMPANHLRGAVTAILALLMREVASGYCNLVPIFGGFDPFPPNSWLDGNENLPFF